MVREGTIAGAVLLAIGVAGCSDPVKDAEARYAIVNKSGSADEVCAEGRKLTDAYLQAHDAAGYNARKLRTDLDCSGRRLDEDQGIYRLPDGSEGRASGGEGFDNM